MSLLSSFCHTCTILFNPDRKTAWTHCLSGLPMHVGCFEAWTGDWDSSRHYQQGLWWQSSMSTNLLSHQDSVGWAESAEVCCTRRSDWCWDHSESSKPQTSIQITHIRLLSSRQTMHTSQVGFCSILQVSVLKIKCQQVFSNMRAQVSKFSQHIIWSHHPADFTCHS